MNRRIGVTLSALVVAAGTALATAPSAVAGPSVGTNGFVRASCPGSQIERGGLRDSYNRLHPTAYYQLFYSSANGGTNCLIVYDNKSGKHYLGAVVQETGYQTRYASDFGTYDLYAGAAGVTHMNGRCLDWAARIDDGGRSYAAHGFNTHCG